MAVPEFGGCPWPMDPACATEEWDAFDPEVQDRALALASASLERLTGYRVGNCPVKIRPCTAGNALDYGFNPFSGGYYQPINISGSWYNLACQTPSCASSCEVTLPAPVGRVYEVKVDGTALDVATYKVVGNILVWQGPGDCPWRFIQDLSKDDNEVGTFSVTYLNAYPVDAIGAYAVGVLAMEFAKACTGEDCELPDNVTQITRQGLTLTVTAGMFPEGQTGLRAVDTFIGLWNPGHLKQDSIVWTPDMPRQRIEGVPAIGPDIPDEFDGGSA